MISTFKDIHFLPLHHLALHYIRPLTPLCSVCTCLTLQIFVLCRGHIVVATSGGLEQRRIPGSRSEQLAAVFASLIASVFHVSFGFLGCEALTRRLDTGRLKLRWSAQHPWNMHGALCDQRKRFERWIFHDEAPPG